ncbi:serine hydroxymethyltransferase, partial [mine drainage metagenome]
ARATVRNARALAQALHDRGFDVLAADLGFTRSHTLAVRVEREGGGESVAQRLAAVGVIANKNLLPGDTSPKHPGGIRIGTPEVTRLGMGEREMVRVAEILDDLLHRGKPPEAVAAEVAELKAGFTTLRYCFAAGEAAYRYYDLVGRDPP